jgi:hypothetical protein
MAANGNGDLSVLEKYQADNPNLMFVICRNKNANTVCYEAVKEGDKLGGAAIQVYWLDIEPSYVEAARKKGKMDDRVELNVIEKKMAYGCSATASTTTPGEYSVKLVAFPKRLGTLKLAADGTTPVMYMEINGQQCVLKKIFVQAVDRMIGLPKVEYIELFGVDADGNAAQERLKP